MSRQKMLPPSPTPGGRLDPPHGISQVSAQKAQIWTTAKLLLIQRNIVFPLIPTFWKPHELFLKVFYSKCVQKLEYSYVNKIQVNIHPQRILVPVFALFWMFPKRAATLERETALRIGTPLFFIDQIFRARDSRGRPRDFSAVAPA